MIFHKVLIAEDHQSTGSTLRNLLAEFEVAVYNYVYYCDDALTRIRNEAVAGHPYELLITDLSFAPGDRRQELSHGAALIAAARRFQPTLKVLVFSIEHRGIVVKKLFDDLKIDGYVAKGPEDVRELRAAIPTIGSGGRHVPVWLRQAVSVTNAHDFTSLDLEIISLIGQGRSQKEISAALAQKGGIPSSESSIEKRLKHIRDAFGFRNNIQLALFCRDTGLI